jgi:DNA-binding transcriptional ArsR family regulator
MGLEKCFVNSSTLAVLKDQLDISPICSWTCGQHRGIQYTQKSFSYFSDKVLDERLERYLPQFKDQILAREVLQVLQTMFNLAGEGFGISTTVLSRQLGVNHKFISETLKRLAELNLIECVDSSYMKGKKAKTYKAKWALKTVIVEKIAVHKKEAKALPVSCVAGQTYKSFLSALWRFDSAENFIEWAMTLPGIHLKGRLGMASI